LILTGHASSRIKLLQPLKTILIGAGKIGVLYAHDSKLLKYIKYAAHIQVIHDHPSYELCAIVDNDPEALSLAQKAYPHILCTNDLIVAVKASDPDVAILAIPPEKRIEVIKALPSLRGVIVEKPLGINKHDADDFISFCKQRNILVQVNLWMRADEALNNTAKLIENKIGKPILVRGIYGNGLRNNGSHLIDLSRIYLGEVKSVLALSEAKKNIGMPIKNDFNIDFKLSFHNGTTGIFQALDFNNYREISLDIWGETGRIEILHEGLNIQVSSRQPHRAVSGSHEIDHDSKQRIQTTAGLAFYNIYQDFSECIASNKEPISSGSNALIVEEIIAKVIHSSHTKKTELIQ
jgi:predicted dehydrogenase